MAKELDVSPFVAAMKQRGRPHKAVSLPGSATKVALWVPTASERATASAAARKYLTDELKLDALQLSLAVESDLYVREYDIELLALVLRDPSDPTQAFVASSEEIRDPDNGFTDVDRKRLLAAVDEFTRERYEPELPEGGDELKELIRGLKADGALSDCVESFDSVMLRRTVRSLA